MANSFHSSVLNPLVAHTVVYLDGIAYYVRNRVELTLPPWCDVGGVTVPAVVIDLKSSLSVDSLRDAFHRFECSDDVFQEAFARNSVIIAQQHASSSDLAPPLGPSVTDYLASRCCSLHFVAPESTPIQEGPYFIRGKTLHEAWRLYPDDNLSFTVAVIPDHDGAKYSFMPLHAGAYSGLHPVVAVPSRLYSPLSLDKPLNGLRVSVKDIFHLSGVQTTAGSRSYTRLYRKQEQTAEVVQKMIDLGAVIVGKTKLSAYAGSEVPPEKCIDYFPPWNPRGDGYQGPSGSSSGAGSSLTSYKWLDLALGTDSTGSIRMPAASYGVWGLRATFGSFPMVGIFPSVEAFDTLGVLSRSPTRLRHLLSSVLNHRMVNASYSPFSTIELETRRPWNLLYPTDWFPMGNTSQQKMVEMFLQAVEDELEVKATRISLEEEWSKTAPPGLRNTTLDKYLDKSIYWPNYYDGFHSWDGFREEFRAKFKHPPYASPAMTKRWGLCNNITKDQREQGLKELTTYKSWVDDHILKPESEYNIMLVPLGRSGANYRDVVPQPGGEFSTSAYDPLYFSTVLGLPQLVIPIGQNPYQSRVTERTEYAPIVASLVGPKGSDLVLLDIAVAALRKAGWPLDVQVGRNTFSPGNNSRHVEFDAKI